MLKNLSVIPRDPLRKLQVTMKEPVLQHSYTTVPAVALSAATISIPKSNCQNFTSTLSRAKLWEDGWLKVVLGLLET